jgi:hypothetical protein
MRSWLFRLVDRPAPAAASPMTRPVPVTGATATPAVDVSAGFGRRRPLVDRSGGVAGFELRLPLVALGLESVDEIERVLAAGIALAGGRFAKGGVEMPARPLQAAAHRICALLNHLALDHDTATIADADGSPG